jgi:hypothetical protein
MGEREVLIVERWMPVCNVLALGILVLWFQPGRAACPLQSGEESRQRAVELWEQAIAAKGGRNRLRQVKNILISSRNPRWAFRYQPREFRGIGTRYEQFYVLPNKAWRWIDDRPGKFGLAVVLYDGDREEYWEASTIFEGVFHSRMPMQPDEILNFYSSLLPTLMETRDIRPVPVQAKKAWINRAEVRGGKVRTKKSEVDVLLTVVDGFHALFYLDLATHLPLSVTVYPAEWDADGKKHEATLKDLAVNLSDYRDVDGIQMPHKVGYAGTAPHMDVTYQINVDYDPRLFERLPSLEDGPEAWKPSGQTTPREPSHQ